MNLNATDTGLTFQVEGPEDAHLFCLPLQLSHLPTLIISRHILRQSIVKIGRAHV